MNSTITNRHNGSLPERLVSGRRRAAIFSVLMFIGCLIFTPGCDDGEESYVVPAIPLVSVTYDFDQFGGNGTIVAGETEGALSASCQQTWIKALTVNGSTINFTVDANGSVSSRVGQIILRSGDISMAVIITQASAMHLATQAPDPAEYADYLGDWNIRDYNGDDYTVTLSQKVEGKSFNMASSSWPGLTIECQWSTANNGRRLSIFTQILATNTDGNLIMCLPAYTTATGGTSFNVAVGSGASYFKFDGVSTMVCDGGTSASYDGFIIYVRNADNSANVGWYSGVPNRFIGTVLTKK